MSDPFAPDLDKARRFLATRAAPGAFAAGVTGAHAYGFPSADSDLDLKGIHAAPTALMVALEPPADAVDFLGFFEGLEIDYTSHELGLAIRLLLKGNGNILERLVSPFQAIDSTSRTELTALALGSLSKRFHHHYRGFFGTVRTQARKELTAKRYLYAYRSALTGIHLLEAGECVLDVSVLGPRYGFARVPELIAMKRGGAEKVAVTGDVSVYEEDFAQLEERLAGAFTRSPLPMDAPNTAALEDFLVRERRARF
jgi:uncharacterized protein